VFTNYLLPQQKLVSNSRAGPKVIKKHDQGQTPRQWAGKHPNVRKMPIIRMSAQFKQIHPGALSPQILALTRRLETIAPAKKPARIQPAIISSWNACRHAEIAT
jgi:hypothetical protein